MLLITSDRSPEEEEQITYLVASQPPRAGQRLPEGPGTKEMGEDARKTTPIVPHFTLFYPVTSHSHALVLYIHFKKNHDATI